MKLSSKTLLAAAFLTVLPLSSALAQTASTCSISNWNGQGSAVAANAGSPPAIARYSGKCGLAVDGGKYVVDNTPNAEGNYRARFYVLTKGASGAVAVFKATSEDNGGGAEVLRVDFTGSAFKFYQNGTEVGQVTGVAANKWYSVEVAYKAGASFSADVAGAVSFTGSVAPVTSNIGNGKVGSSMLGAVSGTATGMGFDAFVSTRTADTAIGRLCRGDANGDSNISITDVLAVRNEALNNTLANGQPDCNEDGKVAVTDSICVRALAVNNQSCN